MEKLVIIILALAIILFTTPSQDADQQPVTDPEMSQTAVMERAKEAPLKDMEIANVSKTEEKEATEINGVSTPTGVTTEERPAVEETPTKAEELKVEELEETVKCVDEGDQSLAEYKPQTGSQPNPFENAPPAEIIDKSVEDIIGEDEDRPGEGKHF